MKKTLKLIAIVLVFFVSAQLNAVNEEKEKSRVVTFDSNMTCAECQGKVEGELKDFLGVLQYKTDLASNTITVTYNPEKSDSEKIQKAIVKTGYKAAKRGECSGGCKEAHCKICHPEAVASKEKKHTWH